MTEAGVSLGPWNPSGPRNRRLQRHCPDPGVARSPLVWVPGFPGARGSPRQRPGPSGPSGPAGGGGARRPGACARTSHSAARGRPLASRGGRPARAPRRRCTRPNRCRPRSRSALLGPPEARDQPRARGPALPQPPRPPLPAS